MAKLTTTNITDGDHATEMNQNLDAIEVAVENTLSRDGTAPNQMTADFDLNSNFVLNMPPGTAPTHPLQKQQIDGLIDGLVSTGFSNFADLLDTNVTGAAAGDMLYFDGAEWIATAGLLQFDPVGAFASGPGLSVNSGTFGFTFEIDPTWGWLNVWPSAASEYQGIYFRRINNIGMYAGEGETSSPVLSTDLPIAAWIVYGEAGDEFLNITGFVGSSTWESKNYVPSGHTFFSGTDSAGLGRLYWEADPDSGIDFYHPVSNAIVAKTNTPALGGLQANNTLTGAGLERVLTASDLANVVDGTAENQVLRWDVANGQWEVAPNMLVKDDGATATQMIIDSAGGNNTAAEACHFVTMTNTSDTYIVGAQTTDTASMGLAWFRSPSTANEYVSLEWSQYTGGSSMIKCVLDGEIAFNNRDLYFYDSALWMEEKASAYPIVSAGFGQLWVKTATPNELWFTDDGNNDYQLTGNIGNIVTWASSGGTAYSSGSSSVFNSGSTTTFESGSIFEIEESATMADPTAGFGRYWVRNDVPNVPMFTDDAGDDFRITTNLKLTESVTTTNVITADESGKTFYLNAAGGFTSTLPAPAAGLHYKFIVATAPTTAYVITTNAGANILEGTFLDIVGELQAISAQDTLNFVASTSLVGDSLEVESDGTNWYCTAYSKADGGITVSVT